MNNRSLPIAIAALVLMSMTMGCFYVVEPGQRGVRVTLGKMTDQFIPPGFGLKLPLVTDVWRVNVQQDTREMGADCFSSDLQQITIQLKVLYRIPETSVVSVLRDYAGHPFEKLILPRVQEATKEVTALKTAADIVKTREQIKASALAASRAKVGSLLIIEDLVIEDVKLSRELEQAIEAKMVQQQEAEKAIFKMQQAKTDAETLIIKATALQEMTNAALRKKRSPYRISEVVISASIPPGVSFSIGRGDDIDDEIPSGDVASAQLVEQLDDPGESVVTLAGLKFDDAELEAARQELASGEESPEAEA